MFEAWVRQNDLSLQKVANLLGISRRTVAYYRNAEKEIPKLVFLATKAVSYELNQSTIAIVKLLAYCG